MWFLEGFHSLMKEKPSQMVCEKMPGDVDATGVIHTALRI